MRVDFSLFVCKRTSPIGIFRPVSCRRRLRSSFRESRFYPDTNRSVPNSPGGFPYSDRAGISPRPAPDGVRVFIRTSQPLRLHETFSGVAPGILFGSSASCAPAHLPAPGRPALPQLARIFMISPLGSLRSFRPVPAFRRFTLLRIAVRTVSARQIPPAPFTCTSSIHRHPVRSPSAGHLPSGHLPPVIFRPATCIPAIFRHPGHSPAPRTFAFRPCGPLLPSVVSRTFRIPVLSGGLPVRTGAPHSAAISVQEHSGRNRSPGQEHATV